MSDALKEAETTILNATLESAASALQAANDKAQEHATRAKWMLTHMQAARALICRFIEFESTGDIYAAKSILDEAIAEGDEMKLWRKEPL